MKKSNLFFALIIAIIATLSVTVGWGCLSALRESGFVCIIPGSPSFLFTKLADLANIKYDAPMNWSLVLVGTFITWFIFGFIIKAIADFARRK